MVSVAYTLEHARVIIVDIARNHRKLLFLDYSGGCGCRIVRGKPFRGGILLSQFVLVGIDEIRVRLEKVLSGAHSRRGCTHTFSVTIKAWFCHFLVHMSRSSICSA